MYRQGVVVAVLCALLAGPDLVKSLQKDENLPKGDSTPAIIHISKDYKTLSLEWNDVLENISWGLTIPDNATGTPCSEGDQCVDFGVAKVVVTSEDHCQRVEWVSTQLEELKDCVQLNGHWYGGGEQFTQPWPIEKAPRLEIAYVTADMLQSAGLWYGGVMERYWISSHGLAVKVDDTVPLFVSLPDHNNTGNAQELCFSSKFHHPFSQDLASLSLGYYLCSGNNVREVHQLTFPRFYYLPSAPPDDKMMQDPIWSTWAEYFTDINDTRIIQLAQTINDKGFSNSQLEIDDNWETCYGDAVFDPVKFPDPKNTVQILHDLGFRVTLWIHPFINDDCSSFQTADSNGYLVKDENGITQLTRWWQGNSAGILDFTNPEAVEWWSARLTKLKEDTNLDSFKFDAGETNWLPDVYTLGLDKQYWPNGYTQKYVEAIAAFGDMIETRVGHNTQEHPIFVRMLDRSSVWGYANGIKTLIPAMLHFGIIGYPYVLPDMIGGNGYIGTIPSADLYTRWAQVNTFMPGVQFSIVPWHYEDKVVEECKNVLSLRAEYSDLLRSLAQESTETTAPMMRPLWWLCPDEEDCLTSDQEYLVGDDLLVAPVVEKDVSEGHEVVLPPGTWTLQETATSFIGPGRVTLLPDTHDLDSLVYFKRA